MSKFLTSMHQSLRRNFAAVPILYLFAAVFILRGSVGWVYLAAAILVGLTVAVSYRAKPDTLTFLARWMLTLSAIGLSAAVILSIEKVELLTSPDHVASCSLSPIVACSPVIASPEASAFGFANSFIGIFGFAAVFTAAMTIMAGATKLNKLWWQTLLLGISSGTAFCIWLIQQAVFEIGKLCLYCMLVWLVTFALLWLVSSYCASAKIINFGARINKLLTFKYELITTSYAVVFIIIFYRWSEYWLSLF